MKIPATMLKPIAARCSLRRLAERVTAIVAEVITASTPVAYAPACASTSALKRMVTMNEIEIKINTSGRVARAQSGAMP